MADRTCVYCRTTDKIATFNREHVMPESFGLFGSDTLTLTDEVCKGCNDAFSREIEAPAGRGSLEGVRRFVAGLRDGKSMAKTPRNRVRFEMSLAGWEGVELYYVLSTDGESAELTFDPQVILRSATSTTEPTRTLTLDELRKQNEPLPTPSGGLTIYSKSEEEERALRTELSRLGLSYKLSSCRMGLGDERLVRVKHRAICDLPVARLMAKICFNYMTKRLGGHFALKPEFDEIRDFIRHGKGPARDLVRSGTGALLFEEQVQQGRRYRVTDAHLVGISRSSDGGILGDVSLFNLIRHQVILSRQNPEILHLPNIPFGSRFLWREKRIADLLAWDKDNLVQPAQAFRR